MQQGELAPSLTEEVDLGVGEPEQPTALAEALRDQIERAAELFALNPEFALRMRIARRSGLPFSEVAARWSMEDLAMEAGWDQFLMMDRLERCPDCGVKPSEQLTPGGRKMGEHPAWRLEVSRCAWCDEKDELEAKRAGRPYKRRPARVAYVPRRQGESFFEEDPPLPDFEEEPASEPG